MDTRIAPEDLNGVIRDHSETLAAQLHAQRESLFPPDAAKDMRKFTSGEAAALLGVNDSYLRKLHLEGRGPSPDLNPATGGSIGAGHAGAAAASGENRTQGGRLSGPAAETAIICKSSA